MSGARVRAEVHNVVDVAIPGGTTFRAAHTPGEGGEAGRLLLAYGAGLGAEFRRPAWSDSIIQLPDTALPEIIAALVALQGDEP